MLFRLFMIELRACSALATSVEAGLWGVGWIAPELPQKLGLSKLVVSTLSLELDGEGVVMGERADLECCCCGSWLGEVGSWPLALVTDGSVEEVYLDLDLFCFASMGAIEEDSLATLA